MKLFKYIGVFCGLSLISISFASCAGSKNSDGMYAFQEETPFKITQSYFQQWVAGVQQGGSGIKIHIEIVDIQEGVTVKDIYFRGRKQKAINVGSNIDMYTVNFKKEANRDINMDIDPKKEATNTPPDKFPFTLEDDSAVVSYDYNGELFFVKVAEMDEKPLLAYPGGNPNKEN